VWAFHTLVEKSAEAEAAILLSGLCLACQVAPLCPIKVPIQSPVRPCRRIGLPSWDWGQSECRGS
jgi:hypothetical protein